MHLITNEMIDGEQIDQEEDIQHKITGPIEPKPDESSRVSASKTKKGERERKEVRERVKLMSNSHSSQHRNTIINEISMSSFQLLICFNHFAQRT